MSNLIFETTEMRKAYSETLKELIKEDTGVLIIVVKCIQAMAKS